MIQVWIDQAISLSTPQRMHFLFYILTYISVYFRLPNSCGCPARPPTYSSQESVKTVYVLNPIYFASFWSDSLYIVTLLYILNTTSSATLHQRSRWTSVRFRPASRGRQSVNQSVSTMHRITTKSWCVRWPFAFTRHMPNYNIMNNVHAFLIVVY